MLQQILRDMYVDPELLTELDEQQKQTLFCKMREEQIRRWKVWSAECGDEVVRTAPQGRRVSFLRGADGEPWVWVMGEHPDDRSIEAILEAEAIERARRIAEREAEELRKRVEAQLYLGMAPAMQDAPAAADDGSLGGGEDIYCSVDELQEQIHNGQMFDKFAFNQHQNRKFHIMDTRDMLQEISLNPQKVAQRVALWEKRLTEERTCQIFKKIQKKQQQVAKEAEEAEKKQEQLWREQERKAKQAEQQIREIARKAREEHRMTNQPFEVDSTYSSLSISDVGGAPPNRQSIVEWFQKTERARFGGYDPTTSNFKIWFHGLITRSEAENLLTKQNYGAFLVRLSEKIWGYVISYRAMNKCKHYLVNAAMDKYQFLGSNQIEHNSLSDLINYHRKQPLTGGERLLQECPNRTDDVILELLD